MATLAYQNPVWPGYLADPFLVRWKGEYFAYGTGAAAGTEENARSVFPLLRSADLVHWEDEGGVLAPLPDGVRRAYWAPEVAEQDGRFYLYYSAGPLGRDEGHRLRVAVAEHPAGPFEDRGLVLPEEIGFCIDAHPFRDPRDGRWYLFFATDSFEDRVGTGLAVAPLKADLLRADGPPRPALRANADWQIYERNRTIYDRKWEAWHTVEGPCVVEREGLYYCFYSGGNWQTLDYGVSYGVAEHPLGPWRHAEEAGPIVLRQEPGKVLGPGHNSLVLAPDGRTPLLVYHAWDPAGTARRLCIDPLEWTPRGPRCLGPTTGPQELRLRE